MKTNYDIFISYSHKDYEIALKINDIIRKWGYNSYFEELGLKAGDCYAEQIMEAITNSRMVIAIFSEHSSRSAWNRKEIKYALSQRAKIMVVAIDDSYRTDDWAQSFLSKCQILDISKDTEIPASCLLEKIFEILNQRLYTQEGQGCDLLGSVGESSSIPRYAEQQKDMDEASDDALGKKRKKLSWAWRLLFFVLLFICVLLFTCVNRMDDHCQPDSTYIDVDTCIDVGDDDFFCDSTACDSDVFDYEYNSDEHVVRASAKKDYHSSYDAKENIDSGKVRNYGNDDEYDNYNPSESDDSGLNEELEVADGEHQDDGYEILVCVICVLAFCGLLYGKHYNRTKRVANLKLSSNIDSIVYVDGKSLMKVKANEVVQTHLAKGGYIIDFRAENNESQQRRFTHKVKNSTDVQTLCADFAGVSQDDYKMINCFIAGSKNLDRERDAVLSEMMRMHNSWAKRKYTIFAKTYEDFSGKAHPGGQQELYNTFIKDESDIVIFILDGKIGEKTREEFNIAMESFSAKNHPQIYVFAKTGTELNPDMEKIRKDMEKYKLYWIDYTDLRSLKLEFRSQLNDYLLDLYEIFQV